MVASLLQPFATSITYICTLLLATFAVTLIFKTSATTNFAQGSVAAFGCYFGTSFFLKYSFVYWYLKSSSINKKVAILSPLS